MGLESVELLFEIEKELSISIPNKIAAKIYKVQDLHHYAWDLLEEQNPGSFSKEQMIEIVNRIIANKTGIDITEITPKKSITDDLRID